MKVKIDIDLRPMLPPIRDQGPRPTCLAHATTAAHEKCRGSITRLSPEFLHFFARGGGSSGVSFAKIAATLTDKGQPSEADCPYRRSDPPKGWKPRRALRLFRRASRGALGSTMKEIEGLINGGQVPVLGIELTQSFLMPTAPWHISSAGPLRGLHAVSAVGLGSFRGSRVVLIRNSWGPDWADKGCAWLDDTFITQHLKEVLVLTNEVT